MLNSKHIQVISNKTLILVNSTLAKWMFITISYLKQPAYYTCTNLQQFKGVFSSHHRPLAI